MCGIFGIITNQLIQESELKILAKHAEQRGKDSSGLYISNDSENNHLIYRAPYSITKLLTTLSNSRRNFIMGHSRLITNGLVDNQPVYRDSVCVIHNGIIVNCEDIWPLLAKERQQEIDTEVIGAIAANVIENGGDANDVINKILFLCKGTIACALVIPKIGKLCLFSNNGSLYFGQKNGSVYFASEKFPLIKLRCENIEQIREQGVVLDIPTKFDEPIINDRDNKRSNLVPVLGRNLSEEKFLQYKPFTGRRCTRCILPETMPYIHFDRNGVCNYCYNYKPRNKPRPNSEIFNLVEPYRRIKGNDCIVPFSGGRDSCYALHLIVKELKLNPVTYTYDWGMVTDLGRRNISRVCSMLGVENIIIADDIELKRRNIAKNLSAWLRSPHLGMVSILTAGDKHFFRHIETVKKQTGISLNLWGVNPLEVTYFKSGFLGVKPHFEESLVYSNSAINQLHYQWLRFCAMLQSPGYFNTSIWDTISGEYYRSFHRKTDYYHIFDYWRWDEATIDSTLLQEYQWEKAKDTNTTWRIGDGTAAFYNYIYRTVAGFTEHDTFRSNQIREGDLTREEALKKVDDENYPRYPNIKWYLDAINMDFEKVIKVINYIPKLYS